MKLLALGSLAAGFLVIEALGLDDSLYVGALFKAFPTRAAAEAAYAGPAGRYVRPFSCTRSNAVTPRSSSKSPLTPGWDP